MIGKVLIARKQQLEAGIFSRIEQVAVFKLLPTHLPRRAYFMPFQITAQGRGHVVIEQHPHGLRAGLCCAA